VVKCPLPSAKPATEMSPPSPRGTPHGYISRRLPALRALKRTTMFVTMVAPHVERLVPRSPRVKPRCMVVSHGNVARAARARRRRRAEGAPPEARAAARRSERRTAAFRGIVERFRFTVASERC